MKKITSFFLIAISVLSSYTGFAQKDFTLYNMEVVQQRMYANPAFFPEYSKVNIGLPMLSSQYFNISNSGFKYSDLIKHRADDSLYVDYNNMLSKLKDNNYLEAAIQPDLLSFGFAFKKKNYISFNITEKVNLRFRYPKGLMNFVGKGNGALLGEELKFNIGVDFTHYREYGLGYARKVNDKLTVGGKLKYLYGMENIQTKESDLSITTDPNDFSILAKANIFINASIDTTFGDEGFSASEYALKKKNHGFGIDLGGAYKLNEKFTFSASIIDLGFIKWKEDVQNFQSNDPNAQFEFNGFDMNDLMDSDTTNGGPMEEFTDSLNTIFKIDTASNAYSTSLSTQIYLGANYNFTDKVNAGVLFYSKIYDKKIHPALSLSFNQKIGRWLNYSVSYSMYNRSFNNIGLGIGLNLGPIQLYLVSDNVLGAIFPQNTKNVHLHAGINLTIGRAKKDSDKDGVDDKKDKCPDIPGTAAFDGCPDTDNDQLMDSEDLCPTDSGSIALRGCPDMDNDSISDITDSCPDIPGLLAFNGCPDTDNDSISDLTDSCPDVAGIPAFNGCPDTDNDSIMDKEDACPDVKGPVSNKGCPEVKLNMIDTSGASIKSAQLGENGNFTFDTIPMPDELVRFTLESNDAEDTWNVTITIDSITKKAVRDSTKFYHFVATPIVGTLKQVAIPIKEVAVDTTPIVEVKLEAAEAEVLKKAFNNLEFESGKNVIKKESYSSLDELSGLLVKKKSWNLKVAGHTDSQGNAGNNLKLSEKRAIAIKMYLVSNGVAPNRIKVEWFGATKPIADNATIEGRQKNRRVEMLIFE